MNQMDFRGCCFGMLIVLILMGVIAVKFPGLVIGVIVLLLVSGWINKMRLMQNVSRAREHAVRHEREMYEMIFQSLGKLGKADGIVTRDEADFAKRYLDRIASDIDLRMCLKRAFSAGINSPMSFADMVRSITQFSAWNSINAANLMYLYCSMTMADGVCSAEEQEYLMQAERILGLNGFTSTFFGRTGGYSNGQPYVQDDEMSLDECYRILGVDPSSSDRDIKRAWHKKVLEFHPDKVQGQGADADALDFAHQQTLKVNRAYERIRKERGMV